VRNLTFVSVIRSSFREKSRSASCFFLLIFCSYLLILGKLIVPQVQQRFMAQYHLTAQSFISWALLQPVPSMYSFANEFWWTDHPSWNLLPEDPYHEDMQGRYQWLNHYPLRPMTFTLNRHAFVRYHDPQYALLRSSFRAQTLETIYKIEKKENGIHLIRINP